MRRHAAFGVNGGRCPGPSAGRREFLQVGAVSGLGLSLGGLREIDAELATALAMHEGALLLDGVRELSVEAAEALAAHVGELSLAGLRALPEDVRAALAEHDGPVAIPDALVGK